MIPAINGKTRLFGLLGNPVEHTLSPVIHNYLAKRLGQNLIYVPFRVEEDLETAVKGAYTLNVLGMNVTVPYKKAVISHLVELDDSAKAIGSVNTLVRTDCGYKGYNTDYLGLHRTLTEEGIPLKDRDVIVLGAGGAAMSIVYLCAKEQAKTIYLLNRTVAKAEAIAASVRGNFPGTNLAVMSMTDYKRLPDEPFIVIQTTSAGMYPNHDTVIEDNGFYKNIEKAVDIIYNPAETKFMKLVKEQGGYACNGLKMLLYQGISAYELWNQLSVGKEVAREVLNLLKKEFEAHE